MSVQPDLPVPAGRLSSPGSRPAKVLVSPGVGITGRQFLKQHGYRVVLAPNRGALRAEISDADAIITTSEHYSPQLLRAGPRLAAMALCDEGLNDEDLGIALSLGIEVVPTSHLGTTMIAEQSLALMLACSRQVLAAQHGRARSRPAPGILPMPIQLSGKTLGLIGVGPVGAELARMCRAAFGMRVVGYHPPPAPASKSGIVMMSSAQEVCRAAEVIAVHLPATAASEGLIDAELLTHCRPGAILVSTAEAGVISERALYSALQDASLAAAALDGVPGETPAQRRLLGLPNVSSTSTPAMATREAREAVSLSAAEAIHAVLSPRARTRRANGPAALAS